MSKSRKKVFPKPPEKLNSNNAKRLGANSNKVGYEASLLGIYYAQPRPSQKLTPEQLKQLENLKKNLQSTKQKQ